MSEGVPRDSVHPNLARPFVNMVLSEEGQRTLYELGWVDNPAPPGSQSAAPFLLLRPGRAEISPHAARWLKRKRGVP